MDNLIKPIYIYKYPFHCNNPKKLIVIANSSVNLKHVYYFADIRIPSISRILAVNYNICGYYQDLSTKGKPTKSTFKEVMELYDGVLSHQEDYIEFKNDGLISPKIIKILDIILVNWDEWN